MTADGSLNKAVEAMKFGAYDFITKPFPKEKMLVTAHNALRQAEADSMLESIKAEKAEDKALGGFIGRSIAMQSVYKVIESAAPSKATVFITGESGTGKEVCARAIHDLSPRKDGAFVAINCGAIPGELMESEIFGHIKGAFTGATADRAGAASRAHGGTLFLDEICEMELDLQVKLLRFLQTGTYTPVGGEEEKFVDIRIVCATNRNPMEEVTEGRFREDLYYRLHVVAAHMPPLNQREDDILMLAEHFLKIFATQENKKLKGFSKGAQNVMMNYHWPGNVRQLINVIQNIVVMNDGNEVKEAMLPRLLDAVPRKQTTHPLRRRSDTLGDDEEEARSEAPLVQPLWESEKMLIERAIKMCNGNIVQAAKKLDINPSTIYRKKESWEKKGITVSF